MKIKCIILLLFVLNFTCYSSNFNEGMFLTAIVGFDLQPTKNITSGVFQLEKERLPNYIGLSTFIKAKDNWYLNLELLLTQYVYNPIDSSIKISDNDFYLLDYCDILRGRGSLLIGAAYKFNYERLVVLPYFNVGYIFNFSSFADSFLVKQKGSNNIMEIENEHKINFNKLDFSFGTDVLFYLGKYGGLRCGIKYSAFRYTNLVTSKMSDYYMTEEIKYEEFGFTHHSIFLSAGFFISFLKWRKNM